MSKITIKDVAREAGVSTALVSMVLNARKNPDGTLGCKVAPETASRVMDIVARLGYKPNRAAASLRSRKTKSIGVISPDISNPFFADISRYVENIAYSNGYTVVFGSSDESEEKLGNLVSTFVSDGLDGLLISPCYGSSRHIRHAMEQGLKVVLMNRDLPDIEGAGRVLLDSRKAAHMAVDHLVSNGYCNIEMVSHPFGLSSILDREQGYLEAMAEHSLASRAKINYIELGDDSRMQSRMETVLAEAVARGADAIFLPRTSLSVSAIIALSQLHVRIPQDVAVVGFDESVVFDLMNPTVTRVTQSTKDMAEQSFLMLRDMLERGEDGSRLILEPSLKMGGSTARIVRKGASPDSFDNYDTVLLCASLFDETGGWTVDQQFLDQTGSTSLLAHGLGVPVDNARTRFEVMHEDEYKLYVHTRNWTAPWSDAPAPGIFSLSVDGLDVGTFGDGSPEWAWQRGGTIHLERGCHTIEVKDLTGFDARFDAIMFTTSGATPPADASGIARMRSSILNIADEPEEAGEYDFVVVGGGISGICAAVAAARNGVKVALIQDRKVLGGNNSSEVRVGLGGRLNIGKYPSLGYLLNEFGPATKGNARPFDVYEDYKKMDIVEAEENIDTFLGYRAVSVEKDGTEISSVTIMDVLTYTKLRIRGKLFSDCTGDANLGVLAGADWHMGRESAAEFGEPSAPEVADGMTLGASMQWYSEDGPEPVAFPDIDWGLMIDGRSVQKVHRGQWYWEVGMLDDQIADAEKIRDYGMYVAYSNWSYLKNHSSWKDEYANASLQWLCSVIGKRESRRLMGEFVLREQDLLDFTIYPDGCVSTSWYIDNHEPDPDNAALFKEPWLSHGCLRPLDFYPIPFRCFYSRNVDNLFMAGRDISVSHLALGTTRVMRTCAMMGEVVGMAAKVCCEHSCLPALVWREHWDELDAMMRVGAGRTDMPYLQVYTLVDTTGARSEDC